MLKPLLAHSGDHLAGPTAGRIDPRALWAVLAQTHALPVDERPEAWALDLLTCTKTGRVGLLADHGHAWIRLVRPDGAYCSVGFFPDESTGVEPDERPGLRMPGMLLSPDKYDRVDWHDRSVRIHLDEAAYRNLVAWIEGLQAGRRSGALAFDLVDRSCVGFVVRAAAQVGVAVEAGLPPSRFLVGNAAGVVPARLRQVGYNLVLAALGGRATLGRQWWRTGTGGPRMQTIDGIAPMFASWGDVLNSPVPFYHVRALRDWQDRVLKAGTRLEGSAGAPTDQPGDAQPPHRADPDTAGAGGDLHQAQVAE